MINKELIEKLTLQELSGEYFIVSISVKKDNIIEIIIDGDEGVTIQKCVELSRAIEHNLDRNTEDFELNVSSPGLGKPLKVYRQYIKNIGEKVEVMPQNGKPVAGILKQVDKEGFDVEVNSFERSRDTKKKVEITKNIRFQFDSKPKVKNIISFK